MNFLTELFVRLQQSSPSWFKKLQNIGAWLSATGLGLIGIPAVLEQILPNAGFDLSLLAKIASYFVLAGIIINVVARTPVKDPSVLKEPIK